MTVDGLVVLDKPTGMTSHDVVARCRRRFGQKRVGHAGTLDPDATGVLLVGLGRATRLLRFLTALGKGYTGEVVLGVATSTLDSSGDVVATAAMGTVTLDAARAAAAAFVGEIDQVPPMVSAVHVGGRRLHELARAGVEVERAPRRVSVHRFDVIRWAAPGVLAVEIECSSGTYVRSLAADLGMSLGGHAHLRNLRRTRVGSFAVEEAGGVDDGELRVLPMSEAVRDLPRVAVDDDVAAAVSHGRKVDGLGGDAPTAVVGPSGALLAVYVRGRAEVVVAPS